MREQAYLLAARTAAGLLAEPAVAAAWTKPSALADFSVGGLAAHLGSQVTSVAAALAQHPSGDLERVTLAEHYARVRWIGADLDAEVNVAIRGRGEELAADGPADMAAMIATAVRDLEVALPAADPDLTVRPPAGPWVLSLDDFLVTRMMEIAVHSDDLVASVGLDPLDLPADVLDPVFDLLTGLAVRRHGATAVLRALSRSERAPATISAF